MGEGSYVIRCMSPTWEQYSISLGKRCEAVLTQLILTNQFAYASVVRQLLWKVDRLFTAYCVSDKHCGKSQSVRVLTCKLQYVLYLTQYSIFLVNNVARPRQLFSTNPSAYASVIRPLPWRVDRLFTVYYIHVG